MVNRLWNQLGYKAMSKYFLSKWIWESHFELFLSFLAHKRAKLILTLE